jgi:hypothetical protein
MSQVPPRDVALLIHVLISQVPKELIDRPRDFQTEGKSTKTFRTELEALRTDASYSAPEAPKRKYFEKLFDILNTYVEDGNPFQDFCAKLLNAEFDYLDYLPENGQQGKPEITEEEIDRQAGRPPIVWYGELEQYAPGAARKIMQRRHQRLSGAR